MGHYNLQYEEYYNGLSGKAKYSPRYDRNRKHDNKLNKINYITRRVIRDLTGVLVLSIVVLGCRIVSTPQTKAVYNYSKKIVNQTYDYTEFKQNLTKINLKSIDSTVKNVINRIQINIPQ